MQSGKLGVAVIMLAIVGTIIAAYVMSMDVEEREVIRYNPLVDLTTEFDRESTPEYVTYSPSTNYTGYYTDASVIAGTQYFDGVEFDQSSMSNNFRIRANPQALMSGEITLSDYSGQYPFSNPDRSIVLAYAASESSTGIASTKITTSATLVSLASYIQALNLPDAKLIRLTSAVDLPTTYDFDTVLDLDAVVFTDKNQWVDSNGRMSIVLSTPKRLADNNIQEGYAGPSGVHNVIPRLSCVVDMSSSLVSLYYNNDCSPESLAGQISMSDVIMIYGGSNSNRTYVNLADTAGIEAMTYDLVYMDPSKGVQLE